MDNEKIVVLGEVIIYENGFEELDVTITPNKYACFEPVLKFHKELESPIKVEELLEKIKTLPYSNPSPMTYNLNKFLSNCETKEEEKKVLDITKKFLIADNGDFEITEGDFFFEFVKWSDCRGVIYSLDDGKMLNLEYFNLDYCGVVTIYMLRDKIFVLNNGQYSPNLFTMETNTLIKILERWKEFLFKYENRVNFRIKEKPKKLLENTEKYSFYVEDIPHSRNTS